MLPRGEEWRLEFWFVEESAGGWLAGGGLPIFQVSHPVARLRARAGNARGPNLLAPRFGGLQSGLLWPAVCGAEWPADASPWRFSNLAAAARSGRKCDLRRRLSCARANKRERERESGKTQVKQKRSPFRVCGRARAGKRGEEWSQVQLSLSAPPSFDARQGAHLSGVRIGQLGKQQQQQQQGRQVAPETKLDTPDAR